MSNEVTKKIVKIGADISDFQKKMEQATKSIKNVAKKFSDVGKDLSKKVTAPIVGIGTAAVKIGADFQSGMSKVKAITGATGKNFENLKNKAKELGSSTQFSATQASQAMQYLGMAGWDTNEIMEGMPGLLDLAAASGEDLGTTADIVSDAMTAFGMKAKEAGKFADLLASVSSNANTDVGMLGESFKYVAPIAGSLGYSAEEVANSLGLMANAGVKASQAGTTLRGALSRMVKPSGEAAAKMNELGISLTDDEGKMLPLNKVVEKLRSSFKNLSESEQAQAATTIFGQEAMSGMLAVINAAPEDINKLDKATTDYKDAAKEMASTMNNNLKGSITKLKSALEGAAISLSEILIPIVEKVVSKIQLWTDKFNGLSPEMKKVIVVIAAIAAAIGPTLLVIGKMIETMRKLKIAFGVVKTAASALKLGAILTGPVGIAIAVIGTLGVALYELYKHNETFRNNVQALWDSIKEYFSAVFEAIKSIISVFVEICKVIWEEYGENIVSIFRSAWELIKQILNAAIKIITDVFKIFTDLFKGDWSALWEDIKTLFSDIWEGIKGILTVALDVIKSVINLSWTNIKDFSLEIWEGLKESLSNIWEGIKTSVSEKWNSIKENTSQTWDAIKNSVEEHGGGIKGVIGTAVDGYKQLWKLGFTKMDEISGGKLSEIVGKIKGKMDEIHEKIKNIGEKIKQKLHDMFDFQIPHIKLPHLSISGKFSIKPPKVPHFGVSWHAKGGIFTKPTILGNHGVGDGGKEAILPLKKLPKLLNLDKQSTANIYFQLDGYTLARILGEPLREIMNIKAGSAL
jgi:TP901 family phage tail tape measure protein